MQNNIVEVHHACYEIKGVPMTIDWMTGNLCDNEEGKNAMKKAIVLLILSIVINMYILAYGATDECQSNVVHSESRNQDCPSKDRAEYCPYM